MGTPLPSRGSRLWPLMVEAVSPKTSTERLEVLSQHSSIHIRREALGNPRLSDDAVLGVIRDPRNAGKVSYTEALRGRPGLEDQLVDWPDDLVREDLAFTYGWAESGALVRATQQKLAGDESVAVRTNTARSTSYRDLLDALIGDSSPVVREGCAENIRIDREQMDRLLTDKLARVRATAVSAGSRYPNDAQFLRAAQDKSRIVRWAVVWNSRAPRAAVELVAADSDEENRELAEDVLAHPTRVFGPAVFRSDAKRWEAAIPGQFEQL